MSNKFEKRWFKWDKLMNEGKFDQVIKEFDKMLEKKEQIVVGDMIRRNQCIEELGLDSIRKEAIYIHKKRLE